MIKRIVRNIIAEYLHQQLELPHDAAQSHANQLTKLIDKAEEYSLKDKEGRDWYERRRKGKRVRPNTGVSNS